MEKKKGKINIDQKNLVN